MQYKMGQPMHNEGLGSDIKKITVATGLDKLAKRIAQLLNEDCGCDDRETKLNDWSKDWAIYKKRNNINGNNK